MMNDEGGMKIEKDYLTAMQNLKGPLMRGDEPPATRGLGAVAGTDRVDFSISRDVERFRKILNDIPDVRSPKVDELKPLVEAGTYQVESTLVARKMLETSW